MHILVITQVKKCPVIFASAQDNMTAPAAVTAVGACQCRILCMSKVFGTRAAMSALAEDPYLIYKI
jgi:hypothetical protein